MQYFYMYKIQPLKIVLLSIDSLVEKQDATNFLKG